VEAQATARVILKKGRAKPLFFRHPWVFSGAVEKIEGEFNKGDIVEVADSTGRFIARGYINPDSKILVRLLSWEADEAINDDFWRRRLERAVNLRERALALPMTTDAYRMVFSEGDELPGLIVDKYRDYLVVQFLTLGMNVWRETILNLLEEIIQPAGIIERGGGAFQETDDIPERGRLLRGSEPEGLLQITENGLSFLVDMRAGQKTGFYLDQRENRAAAVRYFQGRSVLDGFCYSAAFSIYAAVTGLASSVVAVDSSQRAAELARKNVELNGAANVEVRCGDLLDEIRAAKEEDRKFDVVILDPPKFARSRAGVPRACGRYREVNMLAMQVLNRGGILMTCSCSQHVSAVQFVRVLNEAARDAGRRVRIFESRSQASDHPVPASCVETHYLKCFFCYVD